MTTEHVRSVMKSVIGSGFDPAELQWFDISDVEPLGYINTEKLLTHRPPFEKSLILWAGPTKTHLNYEMMMLVVGQKPEEGIVIDLSKGTKGNSVTYPPIVYFLNDGKIQYRSEKEGVEVNPKVAELMLSVVAKWYDVLDTGCRSYTAKVKQTFTNKRKMALGKLPKFDWKTVVVQTASVQPTVTEFKRVSHASPRLHDRRGHMRRLPNGRTVWVNPCKVGDASKGVIFHDYQVKEQA